MTRQYKKAVKNGLFSSLTKADPRAALLLASLCGGLIWQAGPLALAACLITLAALIHSAKAWLRWPTGTAMRTLRFAAFWPLLALAIDAAPPLFACLASLASGNTLIAPLADTVSNTLHEQWFGPALVFARELFMPALGKATLLFIRLLVLMGAALLLTTLYSPRSLGLAASWFLRPVFRENGWKIALALALMLQYIPRIHSMLASLRTAALIRGLPHKGLRYWKTALPRLFTLLAGQTWEQALGIASRQLDTARVWNCTMPLTVRGTLPCALLGVGVAAVGFLEIRLY